MINLAPPPYAAGGHWLLPGASAKVDLVRRLRKPLNDANLKLVAADSDPLCAAFHFADEAILLPPTRDPTFLPVLLDHCARLRIRVVLPTRDDDLRFFAAHRAPCHAAQLWPLLSPLPSVETCLDKIDFHRHCSAHGLPVLPRFLSPPAADDLPCFVRPRRGAAGNGSGIAATPEDLNLRCGPPPWTDFLVQPLCRDPEYTIDALFGPDARPVQWIARQRIRVKAGESTVARTVSIPALDRCVEALARSMPLFGPITLQAFYSDEDGPRLVEVNPRFGGASALGIQAGLDSPARLVALAQGDLRSFLLPRPLSIGLAMLRYSQDIFVQADSSPRPLG
jgi:carbamoyl-phosphate synthase large subunit